MPLATGEACRRRCAALCRQLRPVGTGVATEAAARNQSPVTMTIPLQQEEGLGACIRWGYLQIPDPSIMAASQVPICVVHGSAPGRTALLMAGNHGNEYEGQVALRQLAHSIDPETVHGRLIIVPTLSVEASAGFVREWPDGTNFNRVMPGAARGSRAAQLALFVSSVLMPAADIVFDLHTGGHNMRIQPSTMLFALADNPRHEEEVAAHLAMLAPLMMLNRLPPMQPPGSGTVWYEAKLQGKLVIGTEWGGGGTCHPEDYAALHRGLLNTLRHLSILGDGVAVIPSLADVDGPGNGGGGTRIILHRGSRALRRPCWPACA